MAKKKDENPFIPDPATVVKAADLVSENIPPAKTPEITAVDSGGNSDSPDLAGGSEKPAEENAPPINPAENAPPVATPATATTVTAEQLVSETIPGPIGNPPGQPQPKKGRGRPSIPFPECKKCERKHKPGPCANEQGASRVVIPGTVENPDAPENGAQATGEMGEEKSAVNYRQLAEVCFDLSTNTAGAIIGPEWRSSGPAEREGMLVPLEMYLRSQEVKDIPPGAILCFAIAGYVTARLQVPNTRTKLNLAWAWIKSKMPGKRKSFTPKIVKDGNPFSEQSGPA